MLQTIAIQNVELFTMIRIKRMVCKGPYSIVLDIYRVLHNVITSLQER